MRFTTVRTVAAVVVLGAVALVGVVRTRPNRFHVERSATIDAPSEAVFPHINDFRRWTAWSPWDQLDPQMQRSFDGPPSGLGAAYRWTGNHQVGTGSAKITESIPGRRVGIALDFVEPFQASNTATFTLAPAGAATRVTWALDGQNGFVAKLMSLFMDMDAMVGGQFESGLASLKRIAESAPGGGR
jgi:hypothetical protein